MHHEPMPGYVSAPEALWPPEKPSRYKAIHAQMNQLNENIDSLEVLVSELVAALEPVSTKTPENLLETASMAGNGIQGLVPEPISSHAAVIQSLNARLITVRLRISNATSALDI